MNVQQRKRKYFTLNPSVVISYTATAAVVTILAK